MHVGPALTASLVRLLALCYAPSESPLDELRLASRMAGEAALILRLASDVESSVHESLGCFAAEVVAQAVRAGHPEPAAIMVAEAFLSLCPEREAVSG